MWSRDAGQRIHCIDSGQLIITWMSNINNVPMVLVLLLFFMVWDLARGCNTDGRMYVRTTYGLAKFLRSIWVTKYPEVWGSACVPSARRRSAIKCCDVGQFSFGKHFLYANQHRCIRLASLFIIESAI